MNVKLALGSSKSPANRCDFFMRDAEGFAHPADFYCIVSRAGVFNFNGEVFFHMLILA